MYVVSSARLPNPYYFWLLEYFNSNHGDWKTWHCFQTYHQNLEQRWFWRKRHFHRDWKWSTNGSTKSDHAGTCSQQDLTPTASTKPFSRWTSILLKTRCYLQTASWSEEWPSKRHSGYTTFVLGCAPHWSQILGWHTSRATTSKSNWAAYYIETRPCTAMPQSLPTYHPDWSDGDHL